MTGTVSSSEGPTLPPEVRSDSLDVNKYGDGHVILTYMAEDLINM